MVVSGNEDKFLLTKSRNNKGTSDLKNLVQDQVIVDANGVEKASIKLVSLGKIKALEKEKHREELASTILDGIKYGLDAIEVGADLTSVESFNQFWENISEII